MAISPIVTSLPQYVEQNKSELIAKSVLGGDSASLFTLMSGVKGPTTLNLLNTNLAFNDGSQCGFNPTTTDEISQRTLTPRYVSVQAEWCDKNLLNTYAQYQVKIAAGQKELPFETEFTDDIVKHIKNGIEKMLWQGDSTNSSKVECDGVLKILADASVTPSDKAQGTSAYSAIKSCYEAVPEEALKDDLVIFVDPATYREYIANLVSANLYHYNPEDGANDYILPGSSVKVHKCDGLEGTADYHHIVAVNLGNIFFGTDMMGDEEKFELWFSQDNRTFRFDSEAMVGTQVAYPNYVTWVRIAK